MVDTHTPKRAASWYFQVLKGINFIELKFISGISAALCRGAAIGLSVFPVYDDFEFWKAILVTGKTLVNEVWGCGFEDAASLEAKFFSSLEAVFVFLCQSEKVGQFAARRGADRLRPWPQCVEGADNQVGGQKDGDDRARAAREPG